jgi:hypothetical protein
MRRHKRDVYTLACRVTLRADEAAYIPMGAFFALPLRLSAYAISTLTPFKTTCEV